MRSLKLRAACLLVCLVGAQSFTALLIPHYPRSRTQPSWALSRVVSPMSAAADDGPGEGQEQQQQQPPPNLVDKDLFVAAVDTLRAEMAKQNPVSAATEETTNKNNPDDFYAIGKVKVNLNVSSGNPGMDLAESTGGLVLVSGVTGHAVEAGIQSGDTIVGVGVQAANAYQDTCAYCLEDTARVLMGAMKLALENESSVIELELNRLIKMRYA